MGDTVDFKQVTTVGLEASPYAESLAGLRANEARYFWNKYKVPFVTQAADDQPQVMAYVNAILSERALHFAAKPLAVSQQVIDGVKWTHVFYDNGLEINVLYTQAPGGKRAVGIKLANGVPVPEELVGKFKFAHQKSKLAGVIRGSFFVIKGEY